MAASANRSIPDAPIGFDESTPPDGLTGRSPFIAVAPDAVMRQPSFLGAKPRFSIHIGSNQLNGTYTSATSICRRGSVTPAWRYRSAAHSRPANGLTSSRPANIVGSLRMAVAWIQAGGGASG